MAQSLVKVVLSTGKVVLLRQMKVSDTEKAAQKVSRKCDGDPLLMQIMIKKVLVQNLLSKISESEATPLRDVTAIEREDIDSLLTLSEYAQVMKVIGKISGEDELGNEARVEFVEA